MNNKQIYDPVHKFITFTPLMIEIIDTYEFQRLRDLKQLGATCFVFPSATHTRFEHSLGVCHLVDIILNELRKNQPELEINDRLIELVRIGGLIHDLGHGPFSHLYDNYVRTSFEPEHEQRGITIFKNMVSKYKLSINNSELDFICNIIEPPQQLKSNWLYQIVNNKVNHIDVDKIDYIMRDSYHIGLQYNDFSRLLSMIKVLEYNDNKVLAYNEKLQQDIYLLFSSRYRLHKQIYNHHAVKAFEYLLIPILKKIKDSKIDFIDFTDSVVLSRVNSKHIEELEKIYNRQLPILVDEKIIIGDYLTSKSYLEKQINSNFILDVVKISLASNNNQDPLTYVYYFNNKSNNVYTLQCENNSFIIPYYKSETIIRLYSKNNHYTVAGHDLWNKLNFYELNELN
jgi:HD superfamily phosphohydrolase